MELLKSGPFGPLFAALMADVNFFDRICKKCVDKGEKVW